MAEPFVSVIIATRNRSALLAQTLDALVRQQWPGDRFEVIVADNGSTDDTEAVVARLTPRAPSTESRMPASLDGARDLSRAITVTPPPIRYLYVDTPGKSFAVNAALQQARGDIFALTDDDVLPDPQWISSLASAFDDPDVGFVAGRILPRWELPPPSWMSPPLYGVLAIPDNGPVRQPIGRSNTAVIPIGANMAVRRCVVERIGGLRGDLGKLENTLRTGEDHEFFLRMLHVGYRGMYEPAALVHHWVPVSRLTRAYFRQWLHQNGRDVARLEAAYMSGVRRLLGIPRYLWRQAATDAITAARAFFRDDDRERFAAVVRVIWFAGYLRESWRWT